MGCIISLFRNGTFWPNAVSNNLKNKRRDDSGKYATNQEDSSKKEIEHEKAAIKIQAGFRGYKTRKDLVKRRSKEGSSKRIKSPQLSTIKEEEDAATKIQAGVRGYLLRKKMKHSTDVDKSQSTDMDVSIDELSGHQDLNHTVENAILPVSESTIEEEVTIKENEQQTETIPVTTIISDSGTLAPENFEGAPEAETPDDSTGPTRSHHPELEADFAVTDSEIITKDEAKMTVEEVETLLTSDMHGAAVQLSEAIKNTDSSPLLSPVPEHMGDEMAVETSIGQAGPEPESEIPYERDIEMLMQIKPILDEILGIAEEAAGPACEEENAHQEPSVTEGEAENTPDSFADEIKILDEIEETSVTETAEDAGSVVITPEPSTTVELELEKQLSREAGDLKTSVEGTEAPEGKSTEISSVPQTDTKNEPPKEAIVVKENESIAEEVPVQRRSSKRKTAAGAEKYRSGVVVDNLLFEEPTSNIHQLHQLQELDAEIESDAAELNTAASRIQAGFRGYQVRKGLNNAATKIQSNYRGYKTRKELRNQATAAVKIQATVRGYLARKRVYKTRAQQMEQRRRDAARRRSSSSILAANLGLVAARKRSSE